MKYIENNDYKYIYNHLSKNFQKSIKKKELKKVITSYKHKNNKLFSKFHKNNLSYYVFMSTDQHHGVSMTINQKNEIEGLYLTPLGNNSADKTTDCNYYMPIDKKWTILWGGDNRLVNYHNDVISQKYAFDLIIMDNRTTHINNGEYNEDYYAFGENVLSPQDGVVVDIRNTMKDNKPGETDPNNPSGNYVIIRHKENEYSLIAHFKQNSITVKPGDKVDSNTILGECGNSGNSYEPHIHFQIMNVPSIFNNSTSLKIKFVNLSSPIQGQIIGR